MFKIILALLTLALFTSTANAWWALPHTVVVTVAYNHLTPTSRTKINNLIGQSTKYLVAPQKGQGKPSIPPMLEATFFADHIKHEHGLPYNYNNVLHIIHFINIPIKPLNDRTYSEPKQAIDGYLALPEPLAKYNILTSMQAEIKTLTLSNSTKKEKQMAVEMLLDSVSNLHNPMHVASPIIDNVNTLGATQVMLTPAVTLPPSQFSKSESTLGDLHELFDATAGAIPPVQRGARLPVAFFSYAQNKALELERVFGKNAEIKKQLTLVDPMQWLQASLALAQEAILPSKVSLEVNLASHTMVIAKFKNKANYIAMVQTMTSKQLYLAGYRLAEVLNAIYDPKHANQDMLNYVSQIKHDNKIPSFQQLTNNYPRLDEQH
jgi:hypothetical protein